MRKAARKGRKVPRKKPQTPRAYFQAILFENPTLRTIAKAQWIKFLLGKPRFHVITIENGEVDKLECEASRGLTKTAPDMVCFVNRDEKKYKIQFTNARWPFDPARNTDNESIVIQPKEASGWYRMDPKSGSMGSRIRFDYGVDVVPGPPGPSIISVD